MQKACFFIFTAACRTCQPKIFIVPRGTMLFFFIHPIDYHILRIVSLARSPFSLCLPFLCVLRVLNLWFLSLFPFCFVPFVVIFLHEKFPKSLCLLCALCLVFNGTGTVGIAARTKLFDAGNLLGNPERKEYSAVACADGGWGIGRTHLRRYPRRGGCTRRHEDTKIWSTVACRRF